MLAQNGHPGPPRPPVSDVQCLEFRVWSLEFKCCLRDKTSLSDRELSMVGKNSKPAYPTTFLSPFHHPPI
jgi:hypothetical protein